MARKDILVFGAGGHALKVVGVIEAQDCFVIKGYISTEEKGTIIANYPVLCDIKEYKMNAALQAKYYHIAIGENSVRHRIYRDIDAPGQGPGRLAAIISPHAVIGPEALVGRGTAVMHNAVIWNRVNIGICCIVDTGAVVEHHTMIGDFVNISPGAVICGGVRVGRGAAVGAGAVVIEKINIGENSLVGAGSVVTDDIEANVLAVGNPARVIRKRKFSDTYLK